MVSNQLNRAYWMLRVVFGAVPIVAGLDKFTNLLTNWEQYLSPLVSRVVPATTFMHVVGIIEIAAGILVLSKFSRVGAYVVSLWLVGIGLSLVTTGHFLDVAVRDFVMATGAFTLAKLEEARDRQPASAAASVPPAFERART